jgi:hypothetical protein
MMITISKSKTEEAKSTDEDKMAEFEYDLLKALQLRQKELRPEKFRVSPKEPRKKVDK